MKISDAIKKLEAIKQQFGDIPITGGYMSDDAPLSNITVTDDNSGVQIHRPRRGAKPGVFLES